MLTGEEGVVVKVVWYRLENVVLFDSKFNAGILTFIRYL